VRWTGKEFDRASESGIFDGRRVELIDGELLEMPPMNDPHAQGVRLATYALLRVFPPDRYTISPQCPMRLGESRPLPDLVIVPGTPRQVAKHPTSALLVIEVSDTTLEFDRTEKAALYARHMLPEYWVIDLNGRSVEVRRRPFKTAGTEMQWADFATFGVNDEISPMAAPDAVIKVYDLLP
jgi:Uma2 family endonuclease